MSLKVNQSLLTLQSTVMRSVAAESQWNRPTKSGFEMRSLVCSSSFSLLLIGSNDLVRNFISAFITLYPRSDLYKCVSSSNTESVGVRKELQSCSAHNVYHRYRYFSYCCWFPPRSTGDFTSVSIAQRLDSKPHTIFNLLKILILSHKPLCMGVQVKHKHYFNETLLSFSTVSAIYVTRSHDRCHIHSIHCSFTPVSYTHLTLPTTILV